MPRTIEARDGSRYVAHYISDGDGVIIFKLGEDTAYVVECDWEVDSGNKSLIEPSPLAGFSCTCPDFRYRHAGKADAGCKHLQCLDLYDHLPQRYVAPIPELAGVGR